MKEMTACERREAIADALYKRRHDTVSNLAVEFEVSTRTIKNDIAILLRTHPFYTMQGRYGGGIYVMDERLDGRMKYLDDQERELLERLLKDLTGKDSATMSRILDKYLLPAKETINKGF